MGESADNNDLKIAIVGMALRFPGANNPEEFWHNLRNGVESVQFFDEAELAERGVSSEQLNNPDYIRAGAPLDNMEAFDPEFFGFSPKEAGILDPQHRQFYECSWEALERSGHMPDAFDGAIGVFAGCGMAAYFAQNILTNQALLDSVGLFLLRHTGNDKDFLSTRVSYNFDLKGPSINVQTACSTSAVATHMACQSLISGECDMALAGGVTIELPHRVGYLYKEGEILSPDGHCRAFDHRSKGTIFGSGVGVIVLRRLEDALEDGDHIHAVISGSAVNNDGSGKVGYLAPSVEGQAEAINEALAVADLSADDIDYVECHGTGTPVGDPIEVSALTQAFRESSQRNGYCGIGSVKTNIGHLDTAAGVAGIIKAALAIEHGEMPPSLNYEAPNPTIDFDNSPFYVNNRLQSWPQKHDLRRAAVNSLGVGGTNAFVLLEQAPEPEPTTEPTRECQLLVMSACSRKALDGASQRMANYLSSNSLSNNSDRPLADIAHTLFAGRKGFEHRRVLACRDHSEAAKLLEQDDPRRVFTHLADDDDKSVVFMFPGGGAQYLNMGRDLYDVEPVFRQHMDRGFALLKQRSGIDLKPLLFVDEVDQQQAVMELQKPSVQLPAIFILEYALAKLWMAIGIEPQALIGHSMGENTAACIAGVFSYEDALGLVALRGHLMDGVPEGGMLSVPLSAEEVRPFLADDRLEGKLELACINSPMLSIVSGPVQPLEQLSEILAGDEVEAGRVPINIAAHSSMLDGILGEFGDYLKSIKLSAPQLPIVSNRTGAWMTDEQATSPQYWVEHLRNTVLFAAGIDTLTEQPGRVFLEVGPGNILGSLTRQNPSAPAQRVFSSLRHPDERVGDDAYFLTVLGRLWAVGINVEREQLWPGERRRRVPLPTYAFQHKDYWIEPGESVAQMGGKRQELDNWFYQSSWVPASLPAEGKIPERVVLLGYQPSVFWDRWCDSLCQQGCQVVKVMDGNSNDVVADDCLTLDPYSCEDHERLLERLAGGACAWVHAWSLNGPVDRPLDSLLALAQMLARQDADQSRLLVLTRGSQSVGCEAVPYPENAMLMGAAPVVSSELPACAVAFADIDECDGQALQQQLRLLGKALAVPGRDGSPVEILCIRRGQFFNQHFGQVALPESAIQLSSDGCYLITGGLGALALQIAGSLVKQKPGVKLALLTRSGLPEESHWADQSSRNSRVARRIRAVQALRDQGATVMVCEADLSDQTAIDKNVAQISEHLGPVRGVFHTAGVINDQLIPLKTSAEVKTVVAPKVDGLVHLETSLAGQPLDFMLLYSSISAFAGTVGQFDYAAANAFLDAFARSRRHQSGLPVASVAWSAWKDIGMAAEIAAGERQMGAGFVPFAPQLIDDRYQCCISEDQWILDDHRTKAGLAIMPGTGYLQLLYQAAEMKFGDRGHSVIEIRDAFFIAPIRLAAGGRLVLELSFQPLNGGGSQTVLHSALTPDAAQNENWEAQHMQATLALVDGERPRVDKPADIRKRCPQVRQVGGSTEHAHMDFGPHWGCLETLCLGDGESLAELSIPKPLVDDLPEMPLHPGLLDFATAAGHSLVPGFDPDKDFFVPQSYARVTVYQTLTARIFSHVTLKPGGDAGSAKFDVRILSEDGELLVDIADFVVRRMAYDGLNADVGDNRELAVDFDTAIAPAEGDEALLRILSHPELAHIIVSPVDVNVLLEAPVEIAAEAGLERPDLDEEYVAPQTREQQVIAELWADILGLESVGVKDNFFELGGHSLLLIRLVAKVNKALEVNLVVSSLFDEPTVEKWAAKAIATQGQPKAAEKKITRVSRSAYAREKSQRGQVRPE